MAQKSLYNGENRSKIEPQVNICVTLYVSTVTRNLKEIICYTFRKSSYSLINIVPF
jgi:hypothetical protein